MGPNIRRLPRHWRVGLTLAPLVLTSGALSAHAVGHEDQPPSLKSAALGALTVPVSGVDHASSHWSPAGPTSPVVAAGLPLARPAQVDSARWSYAPSTSSSVAGIPASALTAYQRAAAILNRADPACNLDWSLVAAIGRVESDHGRYGGNALDAKGVARPGIFGIALDGSNGTAKIMDTDNGAYDNDTVYDRAVGPMQFIPSTWTMAGVDADQDGAKNPQDIDDAATSSAVYLCAGSEDLSTETGQRSAVYRYNHSAEYVNMVIAIAAAYARGEYATVPNGTPSSTTLYLSDFSASPERRRSEDRSSSGGTAESGASGEGEDQDGGTLPEMPGSDGSDDSESDGESDGSGEDDDGDSGDGGMPPSPSRVVHDTVEQARQRLPGRVTTAADGVERCAERIGANVDQETLTACVDGE